MTFLKNKFSSQWHRVGAWRAAFQWVVYSFTFCRHLNIGPTYLWQAHPLSGELQKSMDRPRYHHPFAALWVTQGLCCPPVPISQRQSCGWAGDGDSCHGRSAAALGPWASLVQMYARREGSPPCSPLPLPAWSAPAGVGNPWISETITELCPGEALPACSDSLRARGQDLSLGGWNNRVMVRCAGPSQTGYIPTSAFCFPD